MKTRNIWLDRKRIGETDENYSICIETKLPDLRLTETITRTLLGNELEFFRDYVQQVIICLNNF